MDMRLFGLSAPAARAPAVRSRGSITKMNRYNQRRADLTAARRNEVLRYILDNGPQDILSLHRAFREVAEGTLYADLSYLVDEQHLVYTRERPRKWGTPEQLAGQRTGNVEYIPRQDEIMALLADGVGRGSEEIRQALPPELRVDVRCIIRSMQRMAAERLVRRVVNNRRVTWQKV